VIDMGTGNRWLGLFWRAYRLWLRHDCVDLSAAFAYHGLQSLFPLCLIALSAASALIGRQEFLQDRLALVLADIFPPQALPVIEDGVDRFVRQGAGAGFIGLLVLALTSTNAYLTLQRGADRFWCACSDLPPQASPWWRFLRRYLRLRLKALLSVSLLGGVVVGGQVLLRWGGPGFWALAPNPAPVPGYRLVALLLAVGLSLVLLKTLPSCRVPWRAFWPGALLLGLTMNLLNRVLAAALVSLGLRFQAYGLVGAVLLFTLWVWLVGVLLYYAQCLSLVFWQSTRGASTRMGQDPMSR
jgi:membrane protein